MINAIDFAAAGAVTTRICEFSYVGSEDAILIPCALLDGPRREVWSAAVSTQVPPFRVIEIVRPYSEETLADVTELAYSELLECIGRIEQRHLLRMWTFFPEITAGEGEEEAYKRFCAGRMRARGWRDLGIPPAATVIGSKGHGERELRIVALCGTNPGVPVENPRQTSSWLYPKQYGRIPPSFSRGMLVSTGNESYLLASGTASIVADATRHQNDLHKQVAEIVRNLESLIQEAAKHLDVRAERSDAISLRAYLRDAGQRDEFRQAMAACWPDAPPIMVVNGDVCRSDLMVEIEGVFLVRDNPPKQVTIASPQRASNLCASL